MNRYLEIADDIQNNLDMGLISYEFAKEINDLAYDKYIYEEADAYTMEKIKNKFKNSVNGMSKKYMQGLNKRGEIAAKVILRKPKADAPQDVVSEYNERVTKVKTLYKVGEIVVLKSVTAGPLDWLITAAAINGLRQSDDPSDKYVLHTLTQIKDKAIELRDRAVKYLKGIDGQVFTQKDKATLDKFYAEGLTIAKDIDRHKGELKPMIDFTVESTDDDRNYFDEIHELIYNESGELTDTYFEDLWDYIINSDYNNDNVRLAIECALIEI